MRGEDLSREASQAFARMHYRGAPKVNDQPMYDHARRVADTAESLAARYFRERCGFLLPTDLLRVEEAWHLGLLHDTMRRGRANYNDVVDVTNLSVADMLSAITPDSRLPHQRRMEEWVCSLARACEVAKLVKLADIGSHVHATLLKPRGQSARNETNAWVVDTLRCLDAIHSIKLTEFSKELDWCRRALKIVAITTASKLTVDVTQLKAEVANDFPLNFTRSRARQSRRRVGRAQPKYR